MTKKCAAVPEGENVISKVLILMINKFYSESVSTSLVPKQLRLEREKYFKTRNVSSISGIKPKLWECRRARQNALAPTLCFS